MKNKLRKTSKKLNDSKIFKGGSTITIEGKQYVYNVGMPIGRGKFSAVYTATTNENGKKYALKIVNSKSTDIDILIKNEMNILNKLKPVCNDFILCVNDYEKKDGFHYIVTEYLDGYIELFTYIGGEYDEDTGHLIKEYKPTDDQLIKIIHNLCKGLIKIHEQGVAHRDIKPENIMIHPDTLEIKYIDFGYSCNKNMESNIFNQICNHIAGTPEYYDESIIYPTENQNVLTGDHFNILQKSDIWSLGMTIFVLVSMKDKNGAFVPASYGYGYNKFKEIIYKYKNKDLADIGININIKRVMNLAKYLYHDAIDQNMYSLDLIKAFADDINEREIYSPKKRSHSSVKRSHSSVKRSHSRLKRSRSSIKRSRSSSIKRSNSSPITKRITQKRSKSSSSLRSNTI